MGTAKRILMILIGLLSLAAGAAKLMRMPQEVGFFEQAGLGEGLLFALGMIQVVGVFAALFVKWRSAGLWMMVAGFVISSIAILMTGNLLFALISMIPALIGIWLALNPPR